jgi:hypothetical protein
MASAHSAVTPFGELIVGLGLDIDCGMHPVSSARDKADATRARTLMPAV